VITEIGDQITVSVDSTSVVVDYHAREKNGALSNIFRVRKYDGFLNVSQVRDTGIFFYI
jgi:hypothetical protein